MICQIGDRTHSGRAIAIDSAISPERVSAAVRHGADQSAEPAIAVEAADPGPLNEYVGCIQPDMPLRPRTALAIAGRSRGWTTDVDTELAAVKARLAEQEPVEVPRDESARAAMATQSGAVERLRERVAAARGRATAGDEGADVVNAVRELSEAETSLEAVREQLETTRKSARTARDQLSERLRLQDRADNLERAARRELVARARQDYRQTLGAVPGLDRVDDPFEAPPEAMAMAIARLGAPSAPVVLATGRFDDPVAAADWLKAPVIQV